MPVNGKNDGFMTVLDGRPCRNIAGFMGFLGLLSCSWKMKVSVN